MTQPQGPLDAVTPQRVADAERLAAPPVRVIVVATS
jgi:hypothetical protein